MSEKILKNILRVGLWVLFAITVIIAVIFAVGVSGAEAREAQKAAAEPMLYWTYVLLAVAAFVAIVFPIVYIIRNPRKAVKVLISLASLCVVVLVAYMIADSTPIVTATSALNSDFSDAMVLRVSGTGIWTTYILFGISIVLLLYTGIRGIIRNL